jgi:hypothetical protein
MIPSKAMHIAAQMKQRRDIFKEKALSFERRASTTQKFTTQNYSLFYNAEATARRFFSRSRPKALFRNVSLAKTLLKQQRNR